MFIRNDLLIDRVERENLPELNDEFLKIINPELDSVDSLRKDVEKKIIQNFQERSQTAYERELSDKAIDFVNPSFAPSMVENYLGNLIEDVKKQNNGEPLDEGKVKEQYQPVAERNEKWFSLRNKIIESEGLHVKKEEVDDEMELAESVADAAERVNSMRSKIDGVDDLLARLKLSHD